MQHCQIVSGIILSGKICQLNNLMGNELPAKPVEKGWFNRLLIIGLKIAGVVLLIALLAFLFWRWQLRQNIDAQIAGIKAEGLPLNWDDLAKWPVVIPDDENAAFTYLEAIDRLAPGPTPNSDGIYFLRQTLSDKQRAEFGWAVATNLPALEMLDEVSNAARCRYPIDYQDGVNAQLPHLAGLKEMAVLLAYDAVLKAEVSNTQAASKDIQSSLKLSQSLNDEPILISQFTSAAILNISCDSLEGVLARQPLSDGQLSQLQLQFTQAEAPNRFLTGMISDRALYNEYIRLAQDDVRKMIQISNKNSPADDQTEVPRRNPGAGWRLIGFWERDRNFYLEAMATNISLIQQGPPASLLLSDVDDQISQQARKGFYIFSSMMLPAMSGVAKRDASNRANLRAAIATLAVERWCLAHHGTLPGSLGDLVPVYLPSVPIDPFNGKPLLYKKLPKGYCIYSVGPNLKDDGARRYPSPGTRATDEQRLNYDIVFTVERQ
jgi:hypothetical protein